MEFKEQKMQSGTPEEQLSLQKAICEKAKEQLSLAQAAALEKQFEMTQLDHAGFFRRRFGKLAEKKEAAWAAYQEAVLVVEQAKLDLADQNRILAELMAHNSQN